MEFNWLGLILATLIPMVMGYVYYHPSLFGNAWMDSIGMTKEKQESANMGKVMGISLVMSLLIAVFMTGFCNGVGQEGEFDSFGHGAAHGAIITVFFVFPIFVTKGLFEHTSFKNMWINALYWGISLALMGGIVDHFHHWPNA